MATTNNRAKSNRQTSAKPAQENAAAQDDVLAVEDAPKNMIPKEIDPHQYITVRNGFQGKLVYKSPHTGERFVWDSFGAEQDIELAELKRAKSSSKKFFINNWFMFDEQWVVDYLGMNQYYKYALGIDSFDSLFELPADEVEAAVGKLSGGQKKSVAYRARQLIADGSIDSNKTIAVLEKTLGVDLVDRG